MGLYLFIFILTLMIQVGKGSDNAEENSYHKFLKINGEVDHERNADFSVKISPEVMSELVKNLTNDLDQEDFGKVLFLMGDEADLFDHVDLSDVESWQKVPSIHTSPGIHVHPEFIKREATFTKTLSISPNGTQSFYTLQQSSQLTGKATAILEGSNTNSSGDFGFKQHTIVAMPGFHYQSDASATSTFRSRGQEEQKKNESTSSPTVSISKTLISSNATVEGKNVDLEFTIDSKAETYNTPFKTFVTLFESVWNVNGVTVKAHRAGKVVGSVVSKVIYSKEGKTLTRNAIKGLVLAGNELSDGISQFTMQVHVWTELVGDKEVEVFSSIQGKVYEKASLVGDMKLLSGSGVAGFEKVKIALTKGNNFEGVGAAHMVKNVMNGNVFNFRDVFSNFGVTNIV